MFFCISSLCFHIEVIYLVNSKETFKTRVNSELHYLVQISNLCIKYTEQSPEKKNLLNGLETEFFFFLIRICCNFFLFREYNRDMNE